MFSRTNITDKGAEAPIRDEPARDGLEARGLRRRRGQVEERVVGADDERVRAPGQLGRHVAVGEGQPLAARLGPQPGQHRRAGVDAVDVEAGGRQRQREAAGPDAELEDRSVAGERVEPGDGGVDVGHVRVPLVVDVREGVAVGPGAEAAHGASPPQAVRT